MNNFDPDWVSPPGASLVDMIGEMGVSPTKAAALLGMSMAQWDSFVVGDVRITQELADRLASVWPLPADFWLRRDAKFVSRRRRLRWRRLWRRITGWFRQ